MRPIHTALCGLALALLAAPVMAQGRPRIPGTDGVPPNPFASNYPSRPPEAARPRSRRARPAGADLRPPRDIPGR
ncbi:hypothetical protein PMNALOAF_0350 [Methylobacterium adhaesivum]|uniref:Uncharacterized protein n=1 Tax=Methylobacterium adhaesivum TaxID=333297 RepID=A0ABT8BDZ1_9HYPH|nr:hypothetical protein [Methylobacterium adhaesivum]MDN3590054.1 hypothetical protein [Methylobacterium adhaesivum]GJD29118.1 hypothetical protein PMNALOAF_0350 [Methylobacterium adhaesivum]